MRIQDLRKIAASELLVEYKDAMDNYIVKKTKNNKEYLDKVEKVILERLN